MASKELYFVGFPSYLDIVFIIFVLLLTAFMYLYRTVALTDTFLFDYEKRPRLMSLYFKGLCRAVWMRQGKLYDGQEDSHALQIYVRECRIEPSHVSLYKSVCGYSSQCKIPVYFLECFSIPAVAALVTSSKFRLSPLGLIHLKDVTEQYEDITVATYSLSAKVVEYRTTERGIEVDVKVEAFNEDDICAARTVMTFLSRSKAVQKGGRGKDSTASAAEDEKDGQSLDIDVPSGIGVKYAKISGDYNPHHLYRWSAKLLGYKSPIAHGMWTVSRVLAELRNKEFIRLGAPLHVEASFKRPLYIPSKVALKYIEDQDGLAFKVHNTGTGEPHVIGRITYNIHLR